MPSLCTVDGGREANPFPTHITVGLCYARIGMWFSHWSICPQSLWNEPVQGQQNNTDAFKKVSYPTAKAKRNEKAKNVGLPYAHGVPRHRSERECIRRFFHPTAYSGALYGHFKPLLRERRSLIIFYMDSTLPSVDRVTTCQGIILPQFCRAEITALSMPPQQGTSMRATVMDLMLFWRRISVSFSL